MSLTIATTTTRDLSLSIAGTIRDDLTKPGSVTHQDFYRLLQGMTGNMPADLMPDYHLSICLRENPYTSATECIGWASATDWDRVMCLQAFVDEDFRSMGLATALASALVADGILSRDNPIGVFSDECVRIAQRLRFHTIYRYRRVDDGWLRSERLFDNDRGEPGSDFQERLCDAASEVRDLPLADGTQGPDA
jgi:hypothetical protein